MSTFSQWWRTFAKKQEVRPVTWLCGSERALVDDVLQAIRHRLVPAAWNYVPLRAGEDSERDIWSEIFALPVGEGASRLVVVRGAQHLKQPERIVQFAKRSKDAHPGCFVVLISDEHTVPRLPPTEDQRKRRAKGDVVPWLVLGTRGHVIECRPFTPDTAEVAVQWVQNKTGARTNVAGYLLNRADGNMHLVRDTCAKLAVFDQEITISAVNDLLSQRPRDSLVNALVAMDKRTALAALDEMPPDEYSRTLGLLDAQLDLAGLVHDMTAQHATLFEIQRAAGTRGFLVKDLVDVARHYSADRRAAIRRTLAVADESLRAGARVGIMESVIALW